MSRIVNFKKYLTELGNEVDVISRHYNKEELLKSNLLVADTEGTDIDNSYYKNDGVFYVRYTKSNSKVAVSEKLPKGIKGLYNISQLDVFHYNYVENGIECYDHEFAHQPHDIIIASSPPIATLLLAEEIKKKYGVKWIADFRDSFFAVEESRLMSVLKKRPLRKLLKSAEGVVFVSDGMRTQNLKYLPELSNKPHEIVFNGYEPPYEVIDETVLKEVDEIKRNHECLLVFTGSVYPERDLSFFLNALEEINNKEVALLLVGVQEDYIEKIEEKNNRINLYTIPKVNYSTSIKIQLKADFLLVTIWKGNYTGFQGKIFEYLYSGVELILDKTPPQDFKEYLSDFEQVYYADESIKKLQVILSQRGKNKKHTADRKRELLRSFQVEKLNNFIKMISNG